VNGNEGTASGAVTLPRERLWVRPPLPLRKHTLMAQRVADVAAE